MKSSHIPSNVHIPMARNTSLARALALFGFFGLLLWVMLWHLVLLEPRTYSVTFILIVYVLPLLMPAKGIIQGKPYTHAWASFIVLLYLMHGITVWYSIPEQWLYALIEIMLCLMMFVGSSYFARLRGKELGQTLPKLKTVMEEEKQRFEGPNNEKDSSA
ncbi:MULTISPECIES: DUF2069 domain-containing protein [Alteromonadaceae]|jgi:uncharacterized membrane protein|uniref:DUF2069 domain-containing protein n=1 Tax=Alteromonadaceae TaxID=72275 RepID=UPI0034C67908